MTDSPHKEEEKPTEDWRARSRPNEDGDRSTVLRDRESGGGKAGSQWGGIFSSVEDSAESSRRALELWSYRAMVL